MRFDRLGLGVRWPARTTLAAVLLLLSAAFPSYSSAFSIGSCAVTDDLHEYGHQWATGNYWGSFGWLQTSNPRVDDWTLGASSLSHLYEFAGSTSPTLATSFIEAGWYKGTSPNDAHRSAPWWFYGYYDNGRLPPVEVDGTSGPTVGTTYVYEILFEGYNSNTGLYDWNIYWNGLGTVRGHAHMHTMSTGHALAGGEVQGEAGSITQMSTHGTPDQEIVLQGYTWQTWNTYFTSTTACESVDITFTSNTHYTDYSVSGTVGP